MSQMDADISSALAQPTTKPALLSLPGEIRKLIYQHIFASPTLAIDLCKFRPPKRVWVPTNMVLRNVPARERRILPMQRKERAEYRQMTEAVFREDYGVRLLSVCRQIEQEVVPFQGARTVQFHCPLCFKDTIETFGPRTDWMITWMKKVEILYTPELFIARTPLGAQWYLEYHTIKRCQDIIEERYGKLGLLDVNKWDCLGLLPLPTSSGTFPDAIARWMAATPDFRHHSLFRGELELRVSSNMRRPELMVKGSSRIRVWDKRINSSRIGRSLAALPRCPIAY